MTKLDVVIGVDVGGTKVCVGLVTLEGNIVDFRRYPQRYCKIESWLDELKQEIDNLIRRNEKLCHPVAVGIGMRGHVNYEKQYLISTSILTGVKEYDICTILSTYYGVPCVMDNDVKAVACAELLFGVGKKYSDFICYNIGTGIAVSIVSQGNLIRGKGNLAGEVGTDFFGIYNSMRSLESVASGRGIERTAEEQVTGKAMETALKKRKDFSAEDVIANGRDGDLVCGKVVNEAIDYLSNSIINMEHLIAPEVIVLVGGVISNDWFYKRLLSRVYALNKKIGSIDIIPIVRSDTQISEIGLLGAASVYLYKSIRKGK